MPQLRKEEIEIIAFNRANNEFAFSSVTLDLIKESKFSFRLKK